MSKPYFPLYRPIPLWPTPPNGNVSTEKITSLKYFQKPSWRHVRMHFNYVLSKNWHFAMCVVALPCDWNVSSTSDCFYHINFVLSLPRKCKTTSFTVTPPLEVSVHSRFTFLSERVNKYIASGFSFSFTYAIASSNPATVTIGRIGPKIEKQHIISD